MVGILILSGVFYSVYDGATHEVLDRTQNTESVFLEQGTAGAPSEVVENPETETSLEDAGDIFEEEDSIGENATTETAGTVLKNKEKVTKTTTTATFDTENLAYETVVALEIHRLTNEERARKWLSPFVYDAHLAAIARGHSEDMVSGGYFDHISPSGCDTSCRLEIVGYEADAWSENIAWRLDSGLPSAPELAEYFMETWLESKVHRENIFSDTVTHEGVGVVRVGDTVYVTVDFALSE